MPRLTSCFREPRTTVKLVDPATGESRSTTVYRVTLDQLALDIERWLRSSRQTTSLNDNATTGGLDTARRRRAQRRR